MLGAGDLCSRWRITQHCRRPLSPIKAQCCRPTGMHTRDKQPSTRPGRPTRAAHGGMRTLAYSDLCLWGEGVVHARPAVAGLLPLLAAKTTTAVELPTSSKPNCNQRTAQHQRPHHRMAGAVPPHGHECPGKQACGYEPARHCARLDHNTSSLWHQAASRVCPTDKAADSGRCCVGTCGSHTDTHMPLLAKQQPTNRMVLGPELHVMPAFQHLIN
jgi:hypothetical protein